MQPSPSAFRALVLLSTLAYIGWFFLPYVFRPHQGQISSLISHHGYGALFPYTWLVDGPLFLVWLASAAGLLNFQNWARNLFLGLTVIGHLRVAFGGVVVSPGVDAMLIGLIATMDGAILALAYFSPLRSCFDNHSNEVSS